MNSDPLRVGHGRSPEDSAQFSPSPMSVHKSVGLALLADHDSTSVDPTGAIRQLEAIPGRVSDERSVAKLNLAIGM